MSLSQNLLINLLNNLEVVGDGFVKIRSGKLITTSTPNQDSPISSGLNPVLGIDVWEHAYYLNYQNKRPDYISSFWNIVNWEAVEKNLKIMKNKKYSLL